MDYLGLKDSSRQLQANCVISYSFYLYLMLYACAARFDVTKNLENFWFLGVNSTGPNAVEAGPARRRGADYRPSSGFGRCRLGGIGIPPRRRAHGARTGTAYPRP